MHLHRANEQIAVLTIGIGRQGLGRGGCGFFLAALPLPEFGMLLRHCRLNVAVVSGNIHVNRAGLEPVYICQDGDLLEFQRADEPCLPLRIGKMMDRCRSRKF